jgi:hypothetical protein
MSNITQPPTPEYSAPPAPEAAQLPGYSQQPRKSYRWVWMILGILALLGVLGSVLLAIGAGFAVKTIGGPSIATDQYYSAIKNQDYTGAYTYLGSNLKAGLSQEAFIQTARQNDTVAGKVSRFAFSTVPVGDPATVTLTVTRTNGSSYIVHLQLRQEGGAWKIAAFDRI